MLKKKYVKSVKRTQTDIEYYSSLRSSAGNLGQLGMNYAHYNGSSSSQSASIGVAIMALSFIFGSSSDEDYANAWIINILETKDPKDYSQLILRLDIDKIGRIITNGQKIRKAERTIKFIELGSPYYSGDKVTRRSSTHIEPSALALPLP